jgi:gliding motility-associated-like protein
MKKTSILFWSFLLLSVVGYGQNPCLTTWHYRVPITLDNTANPNPLVDYQLKFVLNTDSLIQLGALKADGSDLRFTNAAGVLLPFWVVNNTMNTITTEVWVNVDNIPPLSNIDIYMFYGKQDALSVMDGDATFLHYDNFDGTAMDFGKWNFCGGGSGGTIPVVSAGEITLQSSSGVYNHLIKSQQNFSGPITTEMKVNSATSGIAYVGQVNAANDGYGMALENVATIDVMRLVSSDFATGDSCLKLNDQSPVSSVNSGLFQGLWSFSWSQPNEQLFSWPGGSETRTDYVDSTGFATNNKNVVIGSFNNTGSVSIDYVYTRKYSPIVPSYSYSAATELVDIVEASSNAPICVGDSLKLYAPTFAGGVYNWVGPNGFTSTDQNPVIAVSDFTMVGKFIVTVSAPTNCSPVSDSVIVMLDSIPVAGAILSDTTVCYGMNSISLKLANKTGNVVHWESANTIGGPWNIIANTTDSLHVENLVLTQYYRAIVAFGTCGYDTSNIASINVSEITIGGNIIGTTDACYALNTGALDLINFKGAIQNWESSIDSGATWMAIATTNSQISYTNLTDTTWYRVLVKNGVCDSTYSDTSIIFVQPLPIVDFVSASACLGFENSFVNNSSIITGTINNYNWEFTDGSSGSVINPTHTYANHGSFNVKLTAVSDKGCIDSVRVNTVVNPLPIVVFSQADVCDTSTMVFNNLSTIPTGTIDSTSWNYGDGQIDTSLTHLYSTFGAYNVTQIAFSDSGCIDSTSNTVRVLQRAIVDFSFDSVCNDVSVIFTNNTTTFNDSTTYSWNFGDGNTSSAINPIHAYATADTFEVVLQATAFGFCTNTKVDTVVIYPMPQVDFTFNNECQYDSVMYNNTSLIQWGTMTYTWDFGDSITSTDSTVKHQYLTPANYFVTLEATSDFGCIGTKTLMTEVYPLPTANFVYENVCRDTLSPLTNTSTIVSGSMTYLWDFDNGDTTTAHQPNYTYSNDGTYEIQLLATSNYGCMDSVIKDVTVHPIPQTNFVHDTVCNGLQTSITNTTTINLGSIISYAWNLGDTTFSTNTNANHLYKYSGTHDVTLRAVSDKGCLKDTTITILVDPFPNVDFTFDNECVYDEVQYQNLSTIDYGIMTYAWMFGDDSTSTLSDPTHIYVANGFFPVQLTATSDAGCVDSTVKIIEIYALPLVDAGVDTSVSFGFWQPLMGISPTAVEVSWAPGSTVKNVTELYTEARPLEETRYSLTVTDQFGCINSDSVNIAVIDDYKLLVTNVITPNGDGKNDTWKIYNAASFEVVHINVFDRWGAPVFNVTNYQTEWDGNVNLDNLPEGTYHYIITFDETDKNYKGSVSILR